MNNDHAIFNRQIKTVKILTITLSSLLLLASLTQNCYYLGEREESIGSLGLIAYLFGWMDLFGAGISWLANPFLFISWVTLIAGKIKKSLILSIIALILSLSFMLFEEVIANEGGGHKKINGYDMGYYLWISSCGINMIGNLALYLKSKNCS